MGGEFGRGTAMQYGEADVDKKDFSNQVRARVAARQPGARARLPLCARVAHEHAHTHTPLQDLRRSNFTSASCKKTSFMNSKLNAAYFMKAIAYKVCDNRRQRGGGVGARFVFVGSLSAASTLLSALNTHTLCL